MKTEKNLIHIGISGGGFAISGLAGGVFELLESGIKPDVVSGVSSGSILTFILCASKNPLSVIENNAIGFKTTDVFSKPPFGKRGKLTLSAIWNGIFNNYLSKQDRLIPLLKTMVSETEWGDYINDPKSPDGIIMSVDFIKGSREFVNIKDYSYEDALSLVLASSSIPVFVKSVDFKDKVLYDGGVRNHILTEWILDKYDVSESYSVFSRPEDFKKFTTKDKLKTLPQVLMRTIEIMENEISKSDEQLANLKASETGIVHKNFYIKNILDNVYDDNKDKQIELFEYGKKQIKDNL